MRQILTALYTLQYDEYPVPNWIEGRQYEAVEKDGVLVTESETGYFYFAGSARERLGEIFKIEEKAS